MKRLVLCGWNVGFNKVGLTKLLRGTIGYSLSEAKAITDTVLKNQTVGINIPDEQLEAVVSELTDLGVKFQSGTDEAGPPLRFL
jgi:ribosomal protein L7/L12